MRNSKTSVASVRSLPDAVPAPRDVNDAGWLALVAEQVKTLDYGVVQIVVHGGHVVQVERTERHRFPARGNG